MEGKFVIHRKLLESDIWEKPAYYLKIWIWILANAKWKDNKKGGKVYKRGEFLTNYDDIIKENEWFVGWSKKRLTKDQVYNVMDFLRKTDRIHTQKATRGLWIKVLNYDYFQLLPKNESNSESNKESKRKATAHRQETSNTREIQEKQDTKVSQGKHLSIIFLFASKKRVSLEDPAIKQSFIRRNVRAAKDLVPYELKRIEEVMDFLEANPEARGGKKWGLGTISKYVNEDLSQLAAKKKDWTEPAYYKDFNSDYYKEFNS